MRSDPKDKMDLTDTEDSSPEEESFPESDDEETIVMTETDLTDNVGDVSVEINVEELVASVELESSGDSARKKAIRQRLEEIVEDKNVEHTYAIDIEDAD